MFPNRQNCLSGTQKEIAGGALEQEDIGSSRQKTVGKDADSDRGGRIERRGAPSQVLP